MANILGLGNDLIEISRIKAVIKRRRQPFLDRVFTKNEQNYCLRYNQSERNFAGRFAAKEAVSKALGVGFGKTLNWLDVEIVNKPGGRPIVQFSNTFIDHFGKVEMLISISHSKDIAMATAIWVS